MKKEFEEVIKRWKDFPMLMDWQDQYNKNVHSKDFLNRTMLAQALLSTLNKQDFMKLENIYV